ncbi:hypothetical protein [uncultured Paludibaculum sp.]|uniref:hypothetical protein n=1 Tax=uncultured Paludibaculum sp. TaxID=1765020 RepID=UPI002AABD5F1|nr:hypothetical protein [uncultured Paludibaculum sp.]
MLLSDSIDAGSPYVDGRPDPALPWLPFVACLLAGVAAAAFVAPKPQPMADPAGWTIWKALLAVLISAGTTTLVARITLPYFTCCPEEEASSLSWMSGAIGAWFAPIAVLTAQRLSLAIPAAFLCGLAAGRLLRRSSLIIADRGLADDDAPPSVILGPFPRCANPWTGLCRGSDGHLGDLRGQRGRRLHASRRDTVRVRSAAADCDCPRY